MKTPAAVTRYFTDTAIFSTQWYCEKVLFFAQIAPIDIDDLIVWLTAEFGSLKHDFIFTFAANQLARRMVPIRL